MCIDYVALVLEFASMKNYQRAFESVLVGFKLGKDDDFDLAYAYFC
jgi:hypothetical protein